MRRILVPLGVVGLLAAFWFWPRGGPDYLPHVSSELAACAANLRRIYNGLNQHNLAEKGLPAASGPAMVEALIDGGYMEDEPIGCTGAGALPAPEGARVSGYALRDTEAFPLRFPSAGKASEPIAACDNAAGMNHQDGSMNVLYPDGSVRVLLLEDEIAAGVLPPDATRIPVGPGSPVTGLEKLRGR